jgi:4-amino-4-deoxy-L-arabinose transferase-like glycosyltransferase
VLAWLSAQSHQGYDFAYALIWGSELADGRSPSLTAGFAPTPHPLANALAALVSPLGTSAAADVLMVVLALSLGAAGVAAWRIGDAMFGRWAALIAAAVLVTRPAVVASALRGSIDVPALALTLWAIVVLARAQRRWNLALGLLALAGLLRPEAWLLAAAVAVWRVAETRPGRRELVVTVGLAAIAPVVWSLVDLALTGDPLFSLTGTRSLAEELDRERDVLETPFLIPRYLSSLVEAPVLVAGAVGLGLFSVRQPPHFAVALGVFSLALLSFVVIGLAGLPLLARYLLPAAALVVVLAAGAVQRGPFGAAVAAGLALLVAVPFTARDLWRTVDGSRDLRAVQADLRELVARPAFQRAAESCPPLTVGIYRLVPLVAQAADVPPARVEIGADRGILVRPQSARAVRSLLSGSGVRPAEGFAGVPLARSVDWAVTTSCGT